MKIITKHFNCQLNPNTIGDEKWWSADSIPLGWIAQTGTLVKRINYKELFDFAVSNHLIVTEEEWQNEKLYGLFSYGSDDTCFRIPDKRGLSYVGFEDGYHDKLGQYLQDQIVNITGVWRPQYSWTGNFTLTGVFGNEGSYEAQGTGRPWRNVGGFNFNASRVVKTGARVQTRAITAHRIIKYR